MISREIYIFSNPLKFNFDKKIDFFPQIPKNIFPYIWYTAQINEQTTLEK